MTNNFNDLIFESFTNELTKKIGEKSADIIIEKGNEIVHYMLSTKRTEKKFLMVGKIQSGKTLNFISVMASAIKNGTKLFIVMTGLENSLNNQTLNRMKEFLGHNDNLNFLKFYSYKDIVKSETKIAEIVRNIETDKISIITTLKTTVNKITDRIISNNFLKCQEMLIVDDEGDLASLTHSTKKDSKTFIRIKELFENTNSAYLSVTATPHAHILSGKTKVLRPTRVSCIEPGDGYQGLDIFTKNNNFYSIIEEISKFENFTKTKSFDDSILYYLLAAANLLMAGDFDQRSHSNMLVHTDAETDVHKKYKQEIDELIAHFRDCLNHNSDSIQFKDLVKWIHEISEKYNLNIKIDEKFIEHFKYCLSNIVVSQINQNEKPEINNNFCNIFIGSQLVGRGLTLDNLLVTFFTNRAKDDMAIDTLLQRARWFGYRKLILNYMKIFTTQEIIDDFKNIAELENRIWIKLKNAEANNIPFEKVEAEIGIQSEKLIPTNKVPIEREKTRKNYHTNSIDDVLNLKWENTIFLHNLRNSNEFFVASNFNNSKYKFRSLYFNNFDDLESVIDLNSLCNVWKLNNQIFSKIKQVATRENLKITVALLDSKEKISQPSAPRIRNCEKSEVGFLIDNIFQGENHDTKNRENEYLGDIYWHLIEKHKKTIFLQIHYIDPQHNGINILSGKCIYVPALFIPGILLECFKNNVFSSKIK